MPLTVMSLERRIISAFPISQAPRRSRVPNYERRGRFLSESLVTRNRRRGLISRNFKWVYQSNGYVGIGNRNNSTLHKNDLIGIFFIFTIFVLTLCTKGKMTTKKKHLIPRKNLRCIIRFQFLIM